MFRYLIPGCSLIYLAVLATGCVTVTENTVPSSTVSSATAWRAARSVVRQGDDRLAGRGAGTSMAPIYGSATVLIISSLPYEQLEPGMHVAYRNRSGQQVVHRILYRHAGSWVVEGVNNPGHDEDLVTPVSFIGVVYGVFNTAPPS